MTYDPLLQNLPPCVGNHMAEVAKKLCRDNGHCCPYWVHEDILMDLIRLDREDKGNRTERYMNQCHDLEVVIKPPAPGYIEDSWTLGFKCRELFGFSRKPCNFSSKIAEDIMLEQFLKTQKELAETT